MEEPRVVEMEESEVETDIDQEVEDDNEKEEEEEMDIPKKKKSIAISLPKSAKHVYKMFTLSATNQILRGVSPTTGGPLSPRYPTPSQKEKLIQKELKEKQKNQGWMELVASELYSANVSVVRSPREGDITRVSQDPRRGQYEKKKVYGPPYK